MTEKTKRKESLRFNAWTNSISKQKQQCVWDICAGPIFSSDPTTVWIVFFVEIGRSAHPAHEHWSGGVYKFSFWFITSFGVAARVLVPLAVHWPRSSLTSKKHWNSLLLLSAAAAKGTVGAACSKGQVHPWPIPTLLCRSTEERLQGKSYILKKNKK